VEGGKQMKSITLPSRRQVLGLWPPAVGFWIYTASRIWIRVPGTSLSEAVNVALPLVVASVAALALMIYLEIKTRMIQKGK
jgi:hypothetical protein